MLPRIKLVTIITILSSNLVFVMAFVLPPTSAANQPPQVNGDEFSLSRKKEQGRHIAITSQDHPRREVFGDEMEMALASTTLHELGVVSLPEVSNSVEGKHGRPNGGKEAASINSSGERSLSVRRCLRSFSESHMKRQRMGTNGNVAVRSGQEEPGFHADYSSPRTHPPRNN